MAQTSAANQVLAEAISASVYVELPDDEDLVGPAAFDDRAASPVSACDVPGRGPSDVARFRLIPKWRAEDEFRELVGDCEAFLSGRLAERFEDRGVGVPTWAWTNLLAHGRLSELQKESSSEVPPGLALNRIWRRARAYLAAEVLDLADRYGPLQLVQGRLLQPLELDLAGARKAVLWQPNQWAAHVSSALEAHRDAGRMHATHENTKKGKPHGCPTA